MHWAVQVTREDGSFTVAFHDPIDAISWALHVQLALLEAPWEQELLEQPQARVGTCASGRTIFRGLRVRMAINTGVPAEIIVWPSIVDDIPYAVAKMLMLSSCHHWHTQLETW